MEEFNRIRIVKRRILELEEDLRSWRVWYCDRFQCKKAACARRDKKIYDLTLELGKYKGELYDYELSRLLHS
jgi:hypothetical protein